jgi:hypothetical protein
MINRSIRYWERVTRFSTSLVFFHQTTSPGPGPFIQGLIEYGLEFAKILDSKIADFLRKRCQRHRSDIAVAKMVLS